MNFLVSSLNCLVYHIIIAQIQIIRILYVGVFKAGKTDKTDTTFQEKIGIRSVRFSPDGKHLASGDRAGNIRSVFFRLWSTSIILKSGIVVNVKFMKISMLKYCSLVSIECEKSRALFACKLIYSLQLCVTLAIMPCFHA